MKKGASWRKTGLLLIAGWMITPRPVDAFQCPVLIQDAAVLLDAARAAAAGPKARAHVEEATTLINDARVIHKEAKDPNDHNRAMAKARLAKTSAERVLRRE